MLKIFHAQNFRNGLKELECDVTSYHLLTFHWMFKNQTCISTPVHQPKLECQLSIQVTKKNHVLMLCQIFLYMFCPHCQLFSKAVYQQKMECLLWKVLSAMQTNLWLFAFSILVTGVKITSKHGITRYLI